MRRHRTDPQSQELSGPKCQWCRQVEKPWVSGKENNMFKGTKLFKGLEDLKESNSSGVKQQCGVSEGNRTGEAGNVGGARGRSCTPTTKVCCTDNKDFLGELKGQARADPQHSALPPKLP